MDQRKTLLIILLLFLPGYSFAGKKPPKNIAPIDITELHNLSFPVQVSGISINVIISASDGNAAVFNLTGEPNAAVQVSFVQNNFKILNTTTGGNSPNEKIPVNSWTFGGSVNSSGVGVLDANGNLNNVRVGATAVVDSVDLGGVYLNSGTLRVVYQ